MQIQHNTNLVDQCITPAMSSHQIGENKFFLEMYLKIEWQVCEQPINRSTF
jgi:hypothetical protein